MGKKVRGEKKSLLLEKPEALLAEKLWLTVRHPEEARPRDYDDITILMNKMDINEN